MVMCSWRQKLRWRRSRLRRLAGTQAVSLSMFIMSSARENVQRALTAAHLQKCLDAVLGGCFQTSTNSLHVHPFSAVLLNEPFVAPLLPNRCLPRHRCRIYMCSRCAVEHVLGSLGLIEEGACSQTCICQAMTTAAFTSSCQVDCYIRCLLCFPLLVTIRPPQHRDT